MRKILFVGALVALFTACSKENEPTPVQENGKFRVEITHEGKKEAFTEALTLTVVTDQGQKASIFGAELGEPITTNGNTVVYSLTSIPSDRSLETSENVKAIYISEVMLPKEESTEALKTVISIYRNGIEIKKSTHTFRGKDNMFFSIGSE